MAIAMHIPHEIVHVAERIVELAIHVAVHHRAWAVVIGIVAAYVFVKYGWPRLRCRWGKKL